MCHTVKNQVSHAAGKCYVFNGISGGLVGPEGLHEAAIFAMKTMLRCHTAGSLPAHNKSMT